MMNSGMMGKGCYLLTSVMKEERERRRETERKKRDGKRDACEDRDGSPEYRQW